MLIDIYYLSIQIVVYFIFFFLHNATNSGDISGILFDIIANFRFWLAVILTIYISIIPFLIARRVEIHFSDTLLNNLRNRNFENHYDKKKYKKQLNEMQKFLRTFAKIRKISMLDDNYEPDNLADKKIKDFLDTYKSTKLQKTNKLHISSNDVKLLDRRMLNNNSPAIIIDDPKVMENTLLVVNNDDMIDICPQPNRFRNQNLSHENVERLPIKKNAFFEMLEVKSSKKEKGKLKKKVVKKNNKEFQIKVEDNKFDSIEDYSENDKKSKDKSSTKLGVNDDINNFKTPQVNNIDYLADNHPLEISDIL